MRLRHGALGVLIAQAISTAQLITGRRRSTARTFGAVSKRSTSFPTRMKELAMEGFGAPVKLSCADHKHGGMSLVEWDRTKWNAKVPDIQPIKDKCCR
jgi:branched-chain amino acid transport system substrate-binding protein